MTRRRAPAPGGIAAEPASPARRRLIGLALAAAAARAAHAEVPALQPLPRARPARLALVLGGGGCRGYGHLGVLRVLERRGLKPDLVVGSSAGSLVGALYTAGVPVAELERLGERLSPNLLRDWIFPKLGLFGGGGIRRFVSHRLGGPREIAKLPTRFATVATDLLTGEMVVIDQGDVGRAVQASATIPGLIEPMRMGGRYLVDGNLSAPVPVDAARRLGARRVIAIDVTFPPEQADLSDPYDALYQSFSILTRRMAIEERDRADLAIEPKLPEHRDMKPATLHALVEAGERAATEALPAIERLFGRSA